jgi:hypothetical protein
MALAVPSTLFHYGQHKIDLGQPYAYWVETGDRCIVHLYSSGGMGLEPSKWHRVMFDFPTDTAEKAKQVAEQILNHTGPINQGTLFDRGDIDQCIRTHYRLGAFQVTAEKMFIATDIYKSMQGRIHQRVITVKCEFEEEITGSIPVEKFIAIKKRMDVFLKERPEFEEHFLLVKKQLDEIFLAQTFTRLEDIVLYNALEIHALKCKFSVSEWEAVVAFIYQGVPIDFRTFAVIRSIESGPKD